MTGDKSMTPLFVFALRVLMDKPNQGRGMPPPPPLSTNSLEHGEHESLLPLRLCLPPDTHTPDHIEVDALAPCTVQAPLNVGHDRAGPHGGAT